MAALQVLRPIHPFPARMAPDLAFAALPVGSPSLTVLDPMAGSGTSLVAARARGHRAVGFDTDPLAVLIASAWVHDECGDAVTAAATAVLERANGAAPTLSAEDCYPSGADDETRAFVHYWFDERARRQLTALAREIGAVGTGTVQRALWCAFSRLIVTKTQGVSLAMDVSHSRPHRAFTTGPVAPFDKFLHAVKTVVRHAPFAEADGALPQPRVDVGDARHLPLEDGSIDLVITSPPYLNAIDYLRGHRLSLVWIGHRLGDLRFVRATNVGTECGARGELCDGTIKEALARMGDLAQLPARDVGMLTQYVADMRRVLGEVRRVLARPGRAVFVVGDSTIRGVFVRNSVAIQQLAEERGLSLESFRHRPLPDRRRYLPPPSCSASGKKLQTRMREEVILSFRLS